MSRPVKGGHPGVPRRVGRVRLDGAGSEVNASESRQAWLLDLVAHAKTGHVAARVDVRGSRSPMPPVVLALPDRVHAFDLMASVDALGSRPRAFSQVAGRYSPLVLGARESQVPLVIEWWSLSTEEAPATAQRLAEAVGRYVGAEVSVHGLRTIREALEPLRNRALPATLVDRNPLAWLWSGFAP